ncbi:MAG: 3'(2'),5'-bisphosphate nucleotidase CysQ [Sphingobacteriaceae bacterium]|nr:3'(2'),5'-bisphosphate nucleotidase CysQ [Sphingobacteriaceae bacterium]
MDLANGSKKVLKLKNKTENTPELLSLAIEAAIIAGAEILKVYETNFSVELKSDNSPVTIADKRASDIIINHLKNTAIPVLSEEDEQIEYRIRKNLKHIWIIDPLDGTREFVKRNGEFTVNIALIENGKPVIGVIYSPVSRNLYYSSEKGSFKVEGHALLEILNNQNDLNLIQKASHKLPLHEAPAAYTLVASRSHLSQKINERINLAKQKFEKVDIINTGSSIKFCLIAEGLAHEYPRFGNTMEWDTAAGQCIIEQAGGKVIDLETMSSLQYNRENLCNNSFIAYCKN